VTLDELTPWLFARASGGVVWGLERTEKLLAGVGDPHRHFNSLLIGGTNGKGSVTALCDAALRAGGGGRVGMYTSPHLVSFTERVRIDGVPVSAERLAEALERLRPAIEETGASFFEATTAMAFMVFAEEGVDTVVAEVGLGGRLDSTNVLSPLVTAVTNVGLDHTEYLGESLEEIAFEKAGIFKAGVPAIVGEANPAVAAVLRKRADDVRAPLHFLEELADITKVQTTPSETVVSFESRRWGERQLGVPLAGAHQARNAVLAAELLGALPEALRPSWSALSSGFARARWPGRMQIETVGSTTWLFDVAHNPGGAEVLAESLRGMDDLQRPIVALVGILRDKDWRGMLPQILARVDALVLTTPDSAPVSRRWDVAEVGQWCGRELGVWPRVIPDFSAAIARASTMAPHGTVVVTGSVHTVGDAMSILGVPAV